jgi:hypothetical protein
MPSTYEPIATTTVTGSPTQFIDFTSIPSTYTDLVLILNYAQSNAGQSSWLRVGNGSIDTGTNYSMTSLSGNGSSARSDRTSGSSLMYWGFYVIGATSLTNTAIFQFQNYANTTTNKTVLSRVNSPEGASYPGTGATVGLWRSTAAINQIRLGIDASATFSTNTTATLYGIKAA